VNALHSAFRSRVSVRSVQLPVSSSMFKRRNYDLFHEGDSESSESSSSSSQSEQPGVCLLFPVTS
jgi:hypothetical protein